MASPTRARVWWTVAAIAVASLAARLAVAASMGIFQDEALYWWLAEDTGMSFSPQPPGIALLVSWGQALLGPGVLGIRAGSLLCGTLCIILGALLAQEFFGRRAAPWAAAFLAACPLVALVGVVATPDAPIACVWLLFVWVTWRAAQADRVGWWLLCGAVLALGGYTKYMMALAVPCAVLALLSSRDTRRLLLRPGPWLAALVAAALFGAVFLLWNAQNEWPTFRYHLGARHKFEFKASRFALYAGAHLGILSPVLCVGVFVAFAGLWRAWRRSGRAHDAWLLCFGLAPIAFFFAPSVFTARSLVRVHWDLIGYATGAVALAGWVVQRPTRKMAVAVLAVAVPIVLALQAACLWPSLAVVAGLRPPTREMLGWAELSSAVAEQERRLGSQPRFIITGSFDSALCLGVTRQSREGIYTIRQSHDRRYGLRQQLTDWGIDEESALVDHFGHDALFVHEFRHPDAPGPDDDPRRIFRYFEKLDLLADVPISIGGRVVRRFGIYRASQMLLPP